MQQILFFKELDLPLNEIRQVLDDPAFDPIQALQNHRRSLQSVDLVSLDSQDDFAHYLEQEGELAEVKRL